jgi:tetratricopeptide (TPR) repeat protein
MKKIISLISLAIFCVSVFAVSPEYHDAMLTNIKSIDTIKKSDDYLAMAGTFEQIADNEKMEWLPKYYAAFCYVNASFATQENEDKKDLYADKALQLADEALKLRPTESELYSLIGFANLAKLSSRPMLRGMTHTSIVKDYLNKSMELNPNNPRPYYLMGTLTYNLPGFMGGGKENAMPQLQVAIEKFNKFVPSSELSPMWGRRHCEYVMNQQ